MERATLVQARTCWKSPFRQGSQKDFGCPRSYSTEATRGVSHICTQEWRKYWGSLRPFVNPTINRQGKSIEELAVDLERAKDAFDKAKEEFKAMDNLVEVRLILPTGMFPCLLIPYRFYAVPSLSACKSGNISDRLSLWDANFSTWLHLCAYAF